MFKKKILVVLGGNSKERAISLKTGKACVNAIKKLGYKVKTFDPKYKSFLQIKKKSYSVKEGNTYFVAKNFPHHFYGNTKDLLVLYFFGGSD